MSFCKTDAGDDKDRVIFLTEEDAKKPSSVELSPPAPEDGPQSVINEDGSINWNCPCLGGMAMGPCGVEFREAFSCFHYSEAEPKGSDCIEKFVGMQECMTAHPEVYPDTGKQADELEKATAESEAATSNTPEKESKSDSSSAEPKSEDSVKSEDSGVISAVKEPSVEDELQVKLTLEDEKSNSEPKAEVQPSPTTTAEKS